MRRFITYSSIIVAIVSGILLMGEFIVRHYPNSYRLKAEYMEAHARHVKTLILGNSHNYYGVSPGVIGPGAFNLANVTQMPENDLALLEKYYANDAYELKNVILAIDFTGFFTARLEKEDPIRVAYYQIYMGCGTHGWFSKYGLELFNISKFRLKLFPALEYLITGNYEINCDSLGCGIPSTKPEDVTVEHMKRSCNNVFAHYPGIVKENVAYNHYYLGKLGKFCRDRNIRLILVSPPVWIEYYNRIGKQELSLIAAEARRMQRDYGAEYANYMADPRFSTLDNFSDASHLSRLGAERFTRVLMADFGDLR